MAERCPLLLLISWGWYYWILVLGDFSCFVLASDLKPNMTAHSISDVVEQAVGLHCHAAGTGRGPHQVPQRSQLAYLPRVFEEYLCGLEIRHIYCALLHPQTNGKIEHFHEALSRLA